MQELPQGAKAAVDKEQLSSGERKQQTWRTEGKM